MTEEKETPPSVHRTAAAAPPRRASLPPPSPARHSATPTPPTPLRRAGGCYGSGPVSGGGRRCGLYRGSRPGAAAAGFCSPSPSRRGPRQPEAPLRALPRPRDGPRSPVPRHGSLHRARWGGFIDNGVTEYRVTQANDKHAADGALPVPSLGARRWEHHPAGCRAFRRNRGLGVGARRNPGRGGGRCTLREYIAPRVEG